MLKTISVIFIIIFSLSACKPKVDKMPQLNKPQCLTSQSVCVIKTTMGKFTVGFNVAEVKVETPFSIIVSYTGKQKIETINGYMEGKNMFMGKIPLLFKNNLNNNRFIAGTMVVACSEPKMTWRVWIKAKYQSENLQKEMVQGFFVDFTSSY